MRAKIAYQAFQNKMSINELFLTQIQDSYDILTESESIPKIAGYTEECNEEFQNILDGEVVSEVMTQLMQWH